MLKKIISLILCITLLISIMPAFASAEVGDDVEKSQVDIENTETMTLDNLDEVESERDAYSKTYVDEQGQFTKEIYADPIHTEVDGEWEEISTDLSLNKQDGQLETETTELQAAYPSKISSNQEITYTFGDHSLEFTNITGSNGTEEYEFKKDATTTYEDNKITYEGVLPGVTLPTS